MHIEYVHGMCMKAREQLVGISALLYQIDSMD